MESYKYLIIGGGMTGDAAVNGIRDIDPTGSIGLISIEKDPPYNRPALSKGLWKGKPLESIWLNTESKGVTLHLGKKIITFNADILTAQDQQGTEYQGEKILFATGGTPRRLPFGGEDIIYFRTLEDYKRLASTIAEVQSYTVIGGGFIGAEIAAALAMNGKKVTMLFPEDGIGARIYPHDLSLFLNDYFREKGVEVLPGELVSEYSSIDHQKVLKTQSGREVKADCIIAGLGLELNLSLAKSAGIKVGKGILVNENLATNYPDIYAAGDVAEFFNLAIGKLMRVEHVDNANSMGRMAGHNMAGSSDAYTHLPFFYSDVFDLGYEAVGELDSNLMCVADWSEPFRKGVIYYFREERICGVLLWNVWNKIPDARELIAQAGPFRAEEIRAKKIPEWKIQY